MPIFLINSFYHYLSCAKLEVMKKMIALAVITLFFLSPQFVFSACGGGVDVVCTALGDIPTEPASLVKWILGWSIAMGGGIAFLLSLWGGVTIILAGGNPEKMNEGKEIITSAVSGLLFILFSVFLLRLIGVDILGILKL